MKVVVVFIGEDVGWVVADEVFELAAAAGLGGGGVVEEVCYFERVECGLQAFGGQCGVNGMFGFWNVEL